MKKLIKFFFILSFSIIFLLISIACKSTEKEKEKGIHSEHEHKITSHEEHKGSEQKKALYHCPMHPDYTSDKPGECPICGMTLVPVEEEKMEMPQGSIIISPEKQQLIGVTFGNAEFREMELNIRTVARFTYDETRVVYINTKFEGWIEKLYVDYTGKLVRKGEPLFSIYSPELVSAQEEYLLALRAKEYFGSKAYSEVKSGSDTLLEVAKRRLIYWDINEEQIKELERTGKVLKSMIFYAPFTGFVIEKNILQGKHVMPGENLYKIADISNIWALADIYEHELPLISTGQSVIVELPYFPGEEFSGKITYVYPYLEWETRTVKARIELSNKDFRLKPEMYGNVNIKLDIGKKLTIPESAVIDSGERKIVFVGRENGVFEEREVKLGVKAGDYYEVLEGVNEGERVVTSANFLIDSESRLKSALKGKHEH